jgi:hypothetical protein
MWIKKKYQTGDPVSYVNFVKKNKKNIAPVIGLLKWIKKKYHTGDRVTNVNFIKK